MPGPGRAGAVPPPLSSRIIRAVNAFDDLVGSSANPGRATAVVDRLRLDTSTEYDPDGGGGAGPGHRPPVAPAPAPRLLYAARVAEIRAEMVANVWKVVAAEGQQIGPGDTVVILESMKMEIPVLAEDPGVLSKLNVAEGDVIQEGDLIAVID